MMMIKKTRKEGGEAKIVQPVREGSDAVGQKRSRQERRANVQRRKVQPTMEKEGTRANERTNRRKTQDREMK
jgi:hypothetical protein